MKQLLGMLAVELYLHHCCCYSFSLTVCQFAARGDMDWFIVVGTARDLILNPRACSGGCLIVYRIAPDGSTFELVHTVSPTPFIRILYVPLW